MGGIYNAYEDGWECEQCDRMFWSQNAVNQHMNALDHWAPRYECQTCSDDFSDEDECDEHMDDYGHWAPRYGCEACSQKFHTPQQARKHMDNNNHWRIHWCKPCQRGFQNENNHRMHNNGGPHRAKLAELAPPGLPCPACKRIFVTATGLTHHLESGSCPKARGVNRETIYKLVRSRDTQGVITHKQIEWHDSDNGSYIANANTWNGGGYECYLCHRTFGKLASLNQHLDSPTHKQRIYHCISRRCGKEFTALAQLFHHLESESCGATRFDNVQKNVQGILSGQKMIAF